MTLRKAICVSFVTLALLSGGAAFALPAAAVVDRIVATVNGHVILQSEWDEEIAYESVLSGKPPSAFAEAERKAALDRLIDQELLAEQMPTSSFEPASEAEAAAKVAEARNQNEKAGGSAWAAILTRFHLTEKDLVEHVRGQMDLVRLVDTRLRPAVQIDANSVEAYYREQFVPQLQRAGSAEAALDEVSDKIRDLLTEQKVNELLVSWLHTLRTEGAVRVNEAEAGGQEIR